MIYFFQPEIATGTHALSGEEHRHCARVLRKKPGDQIGVLDGAGGFYRVTLTEVSHTECRFDIQETWQKQPKPFRHHLCIAPTKSNDRIEWFVEKACELGVDEITFILSQNSERPRLKADRLVKKAISALKQSKSGFLTQINGLEKLASVLKYHQSSSKFMAYVGEELPYFGQVIEASRDVLTLIGPEGDFTEEEVADARSAGFAPVSLGQNVLRTETAGVIACQFVNMANKR